MTPQEQAQRARDYLRFLGISLDPQPQQSFSEPRPSLGTPRLNIDPSILPSMASSAAAPASNVLGGFVDQQREASRNLTGRLGVELSTPQAQIGSHEQDVLRNFANNASRSVGQVTGDFARRLSMMRQPQAQGSLEDQIMGTRAPQQVLELPPIDATFRREEQASTPARTPEQDILERFANNASRSVGQVTGDFIQRYTPPFIELPAVDATAVRSAPPDFFELPEVDATGKASYLGLDVKPEDSNSSPARREAAASPPPVASNTETASSTAAPVSAPSGEVTDADALRIAQEQDRRRRIIRGILGGLGGLIGVVGAARDNPALGGIGAGLAAGAGRGIDPNQNTNQFLQQRQLRVANEDRARQEEQRLYDRGVQAEDRQLAREAQAQDAETEAQDRAVMNDYRRAQMNALNSTAEYRQHLIERGNDELSVQDAPDSPSSIARRDTIRRLILSSPNPVRAAYQGVNLDALNGAQLREVASDILRRTQSLPVGQRHVKTREIARLIAQMEAQDGVDVEAQPLPAAAGGRANGSGRTRRPQASNGADPYFQGPLPPNTPARRRDASNQLSVVDPVNGARLRDRTLAEIVADKNRQIQGQPLLSGLSRYDDYSPSEERMVAEATQNSRTRDDGLFLQNRGSRSQQFEVDRTREHIYTEADFERARREIPGQERIIRGAANVLRLTRNLTQTQMTAIMSGNRAAIRLAGGEALASAYNALMNPVLLERSGASVTNPEFQRFQNEMSASGFNSPQAFRAALTRVVREAQAQIRSGRTNDFLRQYRERSRGGAQ